MITHWLLVEVGDGDLVGVGATADGVMVDGTTVVFMAGEDSMAADLAGMGAVAIGK